MRMRLQSGAVHVCWPLALASLLAAGCSYVYRPLPEGLSQPWRVRAVTAMFKVVEDLGWLGEHVGVATKLTTMRTMTDTLSLLIIPDSTGLNVSDTEFDGVKVRLYDPLDKADQGPAIMFFHGGGWVFCNVDVHDHMARALARRLNVVVVSVDYRLAPEHPYPAPLDDCFTATWHLLRHAASLGVDPTRVAVMGDSAGGNLAAAVALRFNTAPYVSGPRPKLQVLMYPSLQGFDFTLPSYVENEDQVYGTRITMATFLLQYMGEDPDLAASLIVNNHTSLELKRRYSDVLDIRLLPPEFQTKAGHASVPRALHDGSHALQRRLDAVLLDPFFAPLMASDDQLRGLPTAYVMTTQFDLLRDEGILYSQRLRRAGVPVTWQHYDDTFHGVWAFFDPPLQLEAGVRSMDHVIRFLRESL